MDGRKYIEEDVRIRHLGASWDFLSDTTRPITRLTFAANYAVGKLDVFGYHLVNFCIHWMAAWLLFCLIRITPPMTPGVAFSAALLWLLHPLQTEGVTYIFQRAESLMGLCYLLTLYAVARGVNSWRHSRTWYLAAVAACLVGMGSKPIMVTAPLMVLFYDRIFWSTSYRSLWRRRRGLYLELAMTWVAWAVVVLSPHESRATIGGVLKNILPPLSYAARQPAILLHYLRLVFWPYGFVLDYGWLDTPLQTYAPLCAAVVLLLLGWTIWAACRGFKSAFLGIWFFLTLAPTSSFFPIADKVVEHRMYLALAGVVLAVVLMVRQVLQRVVASPQRRLKLQMALVAVAAVFLSMRTVERNAVYRSRYAMWRDVVTKRPRNPRAHTNLANVLLRRGQLDAAITHYRAALGGPGYSWKAGAGASTIHFNLAVALAQKELFEEAIAHYREALRLKPQLSRARSNLALILADQGRLEEARRELLEAIEMDPNRAYLHVNLGAVYEDLGESKYALEQYSTAVYLNPDSADAHNNLGIALVRRGRYQEGLEHLRTALRLSPKDEEIWANIQEIEAQMHDKMNQEYSS